jgi:hypothetical protein
MLQASNEKFLLVSESVVQTAGIDLHGLGKIPKRRALVPLLPEDLHGPLDCLLFVEFNIACHGYVFILKRTLQIVKRPPR